MENSVAAIERSRALGVRWVETDVRATADNLCLLFHDATLDRVTTGSGPVSALRAAAAQQIRLRNGEPLLPLAEALERWPDLRFNIDVKEDRVVRPLLRVLAAADAWHRVCVASFSDRRLRRVREMVGDRLATSAGPREVAAVKAGLPLPGGPVGPVALQVPVGWRNLRLINPRFVRAAHARGLAVHVWTVNDPVTMRALLKLGVDGLVSDHPEVALRVVEQVQAPEG